MATLSTTVAGDEPAVSTECAAKPVTVAHAPAELALRVARGERDALRELHTGLGTEEPWAVRLLVESLRQGADWAWERLHEWYFDRIERICWRILHDADSARDCALEVELNFVTRYAHSERVLETFPGYLWSMARTTALRRRSSREDLGLPPNLRSESLGEEDIARRSELWRLKDALRQLDRPQLELLRKRYAEGLTLREIAAQHGTSLQNIDQSIRRQLLKLKRLLRP